MKIFHSSQLGRFRISTRRMGKSGRKSAHARAPYENSSTHACPNVNGKTRLFERGRHIGFTTEAWMMDVLDLVQALEMTQVSNFCLLLDSLEFFFLTPKSFSFTIKLQIGCSR